MLNSNNSDLLKHVSRTKFDRMNIAISFPATLGILGIVFSMIAIDSFAQSELTAVLLRI